MNDEERGAVRMALALGDGARMAAAIDGFTHRDQLHQFLCNYDVNDGFLPCHAIARHRALDRGTAMTLYLQFAEVVGDRTARAARAGSAPEWNFDSLLTALETRLASDAFETSEIEIDPLAVLGSEESVRWLATRGVPAEWLCRAGTRRIEREWLLDGDDD
jgi:hypothetical protein